ncbi:DNA-3-methyladenine glycosylase 2 family protein [Ectothiorhodospiraceae bacterium BW-2]|nr:DNA-3-methyladenine glycosylase 2 family protein [Ectothiorhodospiraceae bacterium BW-2]
MGLGAGSTILNQADLVLVLPDAEVALRRSDPIMATLIDRYGRCQIGPELPEPFQTLVHSMIGQQLSVKAARSISQKVVQQLEDELSPKVLLSASEERLRQAGLSRSKCRYLKALSELVESGTLHLEQLSTLSDEKVVEQLIRVPGIGRWTAEMFLIFGLHRPDVFSLGDGGLKRAIQNLYDGAEMIYLGELWRPYRSIASWYLWQSLNNT